MDYFKFDLQLFAADITVNLSDTKLDKLTEGTSFWIGDAWTTTPPAGTEEGAATIKAMLVNGKLYVKAETTNEVAISGVTATALKGVDVAFGTAFAWSTDHFELTRGGAGTKVSVSFTDTSLEHLALTNVSMQTGEVGFDAETACKVTLSQDVTLTVPHPANTEKTMVLTPTAGDLVVLSDGKASHDVVISGFANDETYTMVDNSSTPTETGTLTVETGAAGKLDIAVTGTQVGRWGRPRR